MDTTIKNLDSLNVLKQLIILQKDKQLVDKDSIEGIRNKQVTQLTVQNTNLKKEVVSLNKYKTAFWCITSIVVVETLIIIFKWQH